MSRPTGVVGLGASAGGLSALRKFFLHVPPDSGMAYIVAMHLAPEHESHLTELLQSSSAIPVVWGAEGTPLEADHAYVIPPNHNIDVIDARLHLGPLEVSRSERSPIDRFFQALAAGHNTHAVAVVLSGTGSDGSMGLEAVKAGGGLILAQEPDEAEHAGMPQSAVATGQVDLVTSVAEMPGEILRCLAEDPGSSEIFPDQRRASEDGRDLVPILNLLIERSGQDFTQYKPTTLRRRLSRRMQIAGVKSLVAYRDLLRGNDAELERLLRDLLITVTSFFRDAEAFTILERTILPELFRGKKTTDELRAWSVGCATGEEAYSLAMLLLERAGRQEPAPKTLVFASDVSDAALARAREGRYPAVIDASVSAERLRRFFLSEPGSAYRVSPKLREHVLFARHNVLADPPFAKLDLIVCRNLLIYLRREVQARVLDILHYALLPGGVLFLGPSETVSDGDRFRSVDKDHRIYRRLDVRSETATIPRFLGRGGSHRLFPSFPLEESVPAISYGALHAQLAERHAPPSILITGADRVVHRSDNAGRYLRLAGGEPNDDLQRQILPELSFDLRTLLADTRAGKGEPTSTPTRVTVDGEVREVALHVQPADRTEHDGFFVVSFWEFPARDDQLSDGESGAHSPAGELEALQERLREVTREHGRRDEAMAAANEELQSINEELRSTTEELETSKEELQSMNEELVTTNHESKEKVTELTVLTGDLQNLLAATTIATLFLDSNIRIRRFTPAASELFNILDSDRGRPLADLKHRLGHDPMPDIASVLQTLQPVERELESELGGWFLMRVLPYRTVDDRIDGAVVTFVDVTELKSAELRLRRIAAELTLAEQRERERIAQILHDNLQQLLFSVQYRLRALREDVHGAGLARVAETLKDTETTLHLTIESTRTLAVEMSPPVLQAEGLPAMLEWLASHVQERYELEVQLEVTLHEELDLNREERILLFQSARELLFNVVKHAEAKTARVEAFREKKFVVVVVRDEGKGFDPETIRRRPGAHLGLAALRERLELLGGQLELLSRPGQGTRATIRLPLERERVTHDP